MPAPIPFAILLAPLALALAPLALPSAPLAALPAAPLALFYALVSNANSYMSDLLVGSSGFSNFRDYTKDKDNNKKTLLGFLLDFLLRL